MSNVIQFKGVAETNNPDPPKPKKKISLKYEALFLRNLLIWMVVGVVLSIFLPFWMINVICIIAVYADGKYKSIKKGSNDE